MRAAVTNAAGQVVNVIVVDDGAFNPGPGLTLVLIPEDSTVSYGWVWDGQTWTAPPSRDLTVEPATIPANGAAAAAVTYTDTHPDAPVEVVFTVNGTTSAPEPLVDGAASIDVVSSTPGDVVVVTVDALPGASVTITVEGA